ncbi:hypothetical protein HN011_001419 [Eciton burchellii]|nr:hypothetical protein HN011_001419 [Eciton burchellii]
MKRNVIVTEEWSETCAVIHRSGPKRETATTGEEPSPEIGYVRIRKAGSSTPWSFGGGRTTTMTDSRTRTARRELGRDSLRANDTRRDGTRREISECGAMVETLIGEMEKIALREREESLSRDRKERIRAIVTELRRAIVDKKASNEKEEERLTRKLASTRDEKERLKVIKDAEMRYVQIWERTRREQNMLRYQLEMDEWQETLKDYHVRERNEDRVNGELTRYLTRRVASIEKQIEQWQQRYDREKETYERQIRQVRNEIEDGRKYLEKLTTEYRDNQEFIDMYLEEQEALRRRKEHEDRVQRGTIRMQAWWRGIMVRRKLGPYRPEEKRKKRPVRTKR